MLANSVALVGTTSLVLFLSALGIYSLMSVTMSDDDVRQPELLWGDLQSQFASLHIGAANIERLAAKLGEARFVAALKQLLDASEAGMRAVIGAHSRRRPMRSRT